MTKSDAPARLERLAGEYDALFCDVWGVIRDGERILPAAVEALVAFREQGGAVVLVSNSPRRDAQMIGQLTAMGMADEAFDTAVTSGEATRDLLAGLAPGPAFKLGPDFDNSIYDGLELEFAPLDTARFIACTGLFDWLTETPEDYRDLLTEAKLRRLPMVCANPDIVVQGPEGRLVYCAGALAALYEALGGKTLYAGKPHPPIYDLAYRRLEALTGAPVDKSRILAIGDGPKTDLAGAQGEGLDALFISGGIHGGDLDQGGEGDAARALLEREGATARWTAPSLQW